MNVQSVALVVCSLLTAQSNIQGGRQEALAATSPGPAPIVTSNSSVPADYVIGPDDVLSIVFWKDKDLSADVVVRPDGKITLPLGKEIMAAGLTPDQLREAVLAEARRFVEAPTANVVVKQINSRKVFITGMVEKPGFYTMTAPTTVMQLIAIAGGLKEYAKAKGIVVMRNDARGPIAYPFNYEEIAKGRNLTQNIQLRSGDTVVVP